MWPDCDMPQVLTPASQNQHSSNNDPLQGACTSNMSSVAVNSLSSQIQSRYGFQQGFKHDHDVAPLRSCLSSARCGWAWLRICKKLAEKHAKRCWHPVAFFVRNSLGRIPAWYSQLNQRSAGLLAFDLKPKSFCTSGFGVAESGEGVNPRKLIRHDRVLLFSAGGLEGHAP